MTAKQRRAQQREAMNELHARRKADGLCPDCGNPKGRKTVTCDSHAATDRARHKK